MIGELGSLHADILVFSPVLSWPDYALTLTGCRICSLNFAWRMTKAGWLNCPSFDAETMCRIAVHAGPDPLTTVWRDAANYGVRNWLKRCEIRAWTYQKAGGVEAVNQLKDVLCARSVVIRIRWSNSGLIADLPSRAESKRWTRRRYNQRGVADGAEATSIPRQSVIILISPN